MDIKALQYFLAVYQYGSISAAARHCHISQPSISAAIQHLEDHLNSQLFQRHTKGVIATNAAERLYPKALRLTKDAKAITEMFRDRPAPSPFTLGLSRSLGTHRMSLLLKELVKSVPELELTLVNPEEFSNARIIYKDLVHKHESFIPLWVDQYYLALPEHHFLCKKKQVAITDLNDLPFIHRSPCVAFEELQRRLRQENCALNHRAHIRTVEYALGLVSAGVGAAFVPDWSMITGSNDIQLRLIKNVNISTTIGLAFSKKSMSIGITNVLLGIAEKYQQANSSSI